MIVIYPYAIFSQSLQNECQNKNAEFAISNQNSMIASCVFLVLLHNQQITSVHWNIYITNELQKYDDEMIE